LNESAARALLVFERVTVRAFRNVARVDFAPGPRLNVIVGDNGQGKTSLLEALYFVATSRSFRTDRAADMIQQGAAAASVKVNVAEGGLQREQTAGLSRERRSLLVDGMPAATAAAYATRTPVVVFHPGDLGLAVGGAAERRRLLDRLALFADPETAGVRARYRRAMRERQEALLRRGTGASELDAYEAVAADYGARLTEARRGAALRLGEAATVGFRGVGASGQCLELTYRPGGSVSRVEFGEELARRRASDARSNRSGYGPQRDELELTLNGRGVRRHASQGQQRSVVLGLKLAELECVRAYRGVEPVLLLDDVSSELDETRVRAVYRHLGKTRGQVFVSTARGEGVDLGDTAAGERTEWVMVQGCLSRRD
jgi:DNA replication and repair protein RecF